VSATAGPIVAVRPAGPADAGPLSALLDQLGYPTEKDELRRRLEAVDGVLVASVGGEVAGMLVLAIVPVLHEDGPWCRITALVVDQRHRRAGVGAALLDAAERHARAVGCSRIEATSAIDRRGAHGFYRGRGFRELSSHFMKRPL